MAKLSGALDGIGLPALVRLLASAEQTGQLHITLDRWTGEITFAGGEVVAASLGTERGLAALRAIALALAGGRFAFTPALPTVKRDVELPAPELVALLDELAARRAALAGAVPSLAAVPQVTAPLGGGAAAALPPDDAPQLLLRRRAIRTLLAVDGRQTVAELDRGQGLARTLEDVATLAKSRLIDIRSFPDAPPDPAGPRPAAARPPDDGPNMAPAMAPATAPDTEALGSGAPPASAAARAAAEAHEVRRKSDSPPDEPAAALRPNGQRAAPGPTAATGAAAVSGRPDRPGDPALRYWLRTLLLAALAAALLALTWWNTQRTAGTGILGLPAKHPISTVRAPSLYTGATVPQPAASIITA